MSKRLIYYHHAVLISSDESKLKQGDCLPGKLSCRIKKYKYLLILKYLLDIKPKSLPL